MTGTVPEPGPIDRGFRRAIRRLEHSGIATSPESLGDAEGLLRSYAAEAMADAPERAVELLAELVAIAAATRLYYAEEPPLQYGQVEAFAIEAQRFFNSFWHDTP